MTKRQRNVLDAIGAFIELHGYSPTLADIAEAIGVSSPATVHKHVRALTRDGHLRRRWGQIRSIELADKTTTAVNDAIRAAAKDLADRGHGRAAALVLRHTR